MAVRKFYKHDFTECYDDTLTIGELLIFNQILVSKMYI